MTCRGCLWFQFFVLLAPISPPSFPQLYFWFFGSFFAWFGRFQTVFSMLFEILLSHHLWCWPSHFLTPPISSHLDLPSWTWNLLTVSCFQPWSFVIATSYFQSQFKTWRAATGKRMFDSVRLLPSFVAFFFRCRLAVPIQLPAGLVLDKWPWWWWRLQDPQQILYLQL